MSGDDKKETTPIRPRYIGKLNFNIYHDSCPIEPAYSLYFFTNKFQTKYNATENDLKVL